jgi:hypothetical protein
MNISMLIKTLLMMTFLMLPLNAQDSCDDKYDVCTEKCEKKEDGSEKCIKECDATYEKCLASEPKTKED